MRPSHPSVTAAAVYRLARATLADRLGFRPFRQSVGVRQLIDLLLLMAGTARTLFAVAGRYFRFSHETARRALSANLPDADALTDRLVGALHDVLAFSRRDRRRRWAVAIDTHNVPYYGRRSTAGVVGGQRKRGTKYFFRYATAVLIHGRRRYTVGLAALTGPAPAHRVVAALLDQVGRHGLRVGGVVLDSEFDSGDTLLELQRRGLSYSVPLRRKGRGPNRRNACFAWPPGTVGTVAWVTEATRRPVSTRVLVWRRAGPGPARVLAFAGWGDGRAAAEARRARLGRRRYRQRFGIETSYRQKNQARAWTTSPSVAYRLLLEGLAHLLRQIWVRLTEQAARDRGLRPTAWVGLRLGEMLDGLVDHLQIQIARNGGPAHQPEPAPTLTPR